MAFVFLISSFSEAMKTASSPSPSPPLLHHHHHLLLLLHLILLSFSSAQQPYINNVQLNCYGTNSSSALGYSCNGPLATCSSFLTFRAESPYLSAALISFLFSADVANISSLNSVSDVDPLSSGRLIIIPIPCSCSGGFYQHNASYTLKSLSETYLTVANDTYQGLSTCQAMIDQNPFNSRKLAVGNKLVVPLRCACPTQSQTQAGTKYLVSYLITTGDDVPTIAKTFGADYQSVLSANELNEKSTIFPFTTLLIPLSSEPTKISIPPPPSPPNVPNAPPPPSGGGSSHTGVIVGVAVGVSVLLLLGVFLCLFFCLKRRKRQEERKLLKKEPASEISQPLSSKKKTARSPTSTPSPLASSIREMLDWMTVYTFKELSTATGGFAEDHRIRGSVYRGEINGDTAAIKRVEGDVMSEINILKHVTHSNVIKLSGLCLHGGNTYMVFEFAEMGSLDDWLQNKKKASNFYSSCLNWKQRIQIACDVADGLNYLHNYTNPPYIHKNLKSSNVLLGQDFRAKVANFGLARQVDDGQHQITRHVVGTQGYMAPEYLEHGLITPKLDVFSFGVVLLELLSGKEAIFVGEDEKKGEILLWTAIGDVLNGGDAKSNLRAFVDGCLQEDYPFDLAFAMAELAKRCVSRQADSRPTMDELLVSLSAIYNSTLDWELEGGTSSYSGSSSYKR